MKVTVPDPEGRPVTLLAYEERGQLYNTSRLQTTAKVLEGKFGELEARLNTGEFLMISFEGWVRNAETGKPLPIAPFYGGGLLREGDTLGPFLFGQRRASFLRSICELSMPCPQRLDITVHVQGYRDVGYVTIEAKDLK